MARDSHQGFRLVESDMTLHAEGAGVMDEIMYVEGTGLMVVEGKSDDQREKRGTKKYI